MNPAKKPLKKKILKMAFQVATADSPAFLSVSDLIEKAFALTSGKHSNTKSCEYGGVGAVILTKKGNLYTGISLDNACGIGFCAEHAAVADMLKNHETEIHVCVAVSKRKKVLPPCGRCRELLYQIDKNNLAAQIIVDSEKIVPLSTLHPMPWQEYK
jgi:cytidine deaminase